MTDFFFTDVNGIRTKLERAVHQTIDEISLRPVADAIVEQVKDEIQSSPIYASAAEQVQANINLSPAVAPQVRKLMENIQGNPIFNPKVEQQKADIAKKALSGVLDNLEDKATRGYYITEALLRCGMAVVEAKRIAEGLIEGGGNFNLLSNANLHCFCAMLRAGFGGKDGDKLLIKAARWHVEKHGGPLAVANFDHYMKGSGQPFVEPLAEIIAKEGALAKFIADDIVRTAAATRWSPALGTDLSGDAQDFSAIHKSDKPKWTVMEYHFTFGGVDHFFWTVLTSPQARARNKAEGGKKALVRVRLEDPYEWHEKEARNSQCIHGAMERAQKFGAKNFLQVGTADVMIDLTPDLLVPLP